MRPAAFAGGGRRRSPLWRVRSPFASSHRRQSSSASSLRRRHAFETAYYASNSLSRGKTGPVGACQSGEQPTGREDERVGAGGCCELHRGRQAVLRRAARKRECRPPERAERIGEIGGRKTQRELVRVSRRSDEQDRRGHDEVELAERFAEALAILRSPARGSSRVAIAHAQAALDLAANVLAVQLLVPREERAVDVGDLVHEVGAVGRREWKLD